MSIKKTWFSYILWLIATGFSVLFTYSHIVDIIDCYSLEQFKNPYYYVGFSAAFILTVSLVYILVSWARNKVKGISMSKWGRRISDVFVVCGMSALFVITRCMVLFSTTLENVIPMEVFEAAKVMQRSGHSGMYEILYVFDEIYINVLSGLFLFLGNKMEIMLYFQIFLQAATFLLLLVVGRIVQKGFFGWIPAMVYVLSQFCMDAVVCLDADNFWVFIVVFVIALICMLEKVWKNKTITYILISLLGIVFSLLSVIDTYPHIEDWKEVFEFWFYEKLVMGAAEGFWGFLILVALMFFYCISFWKTKTDNASAYILPIAVFLGLIYFDLYAGFLNAVFILLRIYMSFMAAEGLRILFEAKPKLMTEQDIESKAVTETSHETSGCIGSMNVEDTELEDGVSEDTGVIRVSDILKAAGTEEDITPETKTELSSQEEVVDKTAMIENVLPMPKKHVARTFEYAFEPAEDMMHYDVEVENDDYDYE